MTRNYFCIVPINGSDHRFRVGFINFCKTFLDSVDFTYCYNGKIDYSIFDFQNPITSFFDDIFGPQIIGELYSGNSETISEILPEYQGKITFDSIHNWLEKVCKKKFGENIFAIGFLNHLRYHILKAETNETLLDKPYIHIVFVLNVKDDVEERYISHLSKNKSFDNCITSIDWVHIRDKNITKNHNLFEYAEGHHNYIEANEDIHDFFKETVMLFQKNILVKLIEEVKRNEQRKCQSL